MRVIWDSSESCFVFSAIVHYDFNRLLCIFICTVIILFINHIFILLCLYYS